MAQPDLLAFQDLQEMPMWLLIPSPYYPDRSIRVQSHATAGKETLRKDQNGSPNTQSNFQEARIVIIKSTSTTVLNQLAAEGSLSNYNAVKNVFNLED